MSYFSTSLSSPDSSTFPCGAHLVFVLASQHCLTYPPSSVSVSLSLLISHSPSIYSIAAKVHMQSQVAQHWGVSWWKPRGGVLGIAFILWQRGPFFSFVFGKTRHSCYAPFNSNSPVNGFSSVFPSLHVWLITENGIEMFRRDRWYD